MLLARIFSLLMVQFENCDWWCFKAYFGNIFNNLQIFKLQACMKLRTAPWFLSANPGSRWGTDDSRGKRQGDGCCTAGPKNLFIYVLALPLNNVTMSRSISLCVIKLICLSTKLTHLVPQRQMALEAQGEGEGAAIQGSRSGRGVIHAPGLAEQQVLREIWEWMPPIKIFSECGWKADYYCGGSKTVKELRGEWKRYSNPDSLKLFRWLGWIPMPDWEWVTTCMRRPRVR